MRKNIGELTQRLEAGVKAVYTSESYKNYLSFISKFHRYIPSWSEGSEVKELVNSMSVIKKTAEEIISRVEVA